MEIQLLNTEHTTLLEIVIKNKKNILQSYTNVFFTSQCASFAHFHQLSYFFTQTIYAPKILIAYFLLLTHFPKLITCFCLHPPNLISIMISHDQYPGHESVRLQILREKRRRNGLWSQEFWHSPLGAGHRFPGSLTSPHMPPLTSRCCNQIYCTMFSKIYNLRLLAFSRYLILNNQHLNAL